MTESFEIGTYYMESDDRRVTEIDASGYSISIKENYWSSNDAWAVSIDHSFDKSAELYDLLSRIDQLRVACGTMIALGYEFHGMIDDSTSLWEKEVETPK